VTIDSIPPIGDDATALVLQVLRETVAQQERTIATLTATLVEERGAHDMATHGHYGQYQKQFVLLCDSIDWETAAQQERDRAVKELAEVVTALQAVLAMMQLIGPASVPDRFFKAFNKAQREGAELLTLIKSLPKK
jgi:uncharacterized coiled-coil protein SlyX